MSTLAFDGKEIAFDTQQGRGRAVVCSEPWLKVEKTDSVDYKFAGGCGDVDPVKVFIDWISINRSGPYPEICKDEHNNCFFVAITNDGELHEFEKSGKVVYRTRKYWAAGSGMDFAMGAMVAGKSASEAAMIAGELDPHTNQDIRSFPVAKAGLHSAAS